jgi:hypothetical protein
MKTEAKTTELAAAAGGQEVTTSLLQIPLSGEYSHMNRLPKTPLYFFGEGGGGGQLAKKIRSPMSEFTEVTDFGNIRILNTALW